MFAPLPVAFCSAGNLASSGVPVAVALPGAVAFPAATGLPLGGTHVPSGWSFAVELLAPSTANAPPFTTSFIAWSTPT